MTNEQCPACESILIAVDFDVNANRLKAKCKRCGYAWEEKPFYDRPYSK